MFGSCILFKDLANPHAHVWHINSCLGIGKSTSPPLQYFCILSLRCMLLQPSRSRSLPRWPSSRLGARAICTLSAWRIRRRLTSFVNHFLLVSAMTSISFRVSILFVFIAFLCLLQGLGHPSGVGFTRDSWHTWFDALCYACLCEMVFEQCMHLSTSARN